jgi:Zn-dependent metalloprotease
MLRRHLDPRAGAAVAGLLLVFLVLAGSLDAAQAFQERPELRALERPLATVEEPVSAAVPASLGPAWERFQEETGRLWDAAWAGGRLRRLAGGGPQLVAPGMDPMAVEAVSRGFLQQHAELFQLSDVDLELLAARRRAGIWFVTFQQRYAGYPVLEGRMDLRFGRQGHLLLVQDRLWLGLDAPTFPAISEQAAVDAARAGLPWDSQPEEGIRLVVVPGQLVGDAQDHLAYELVLSVEEPRSRWQTLVDATTGEILARTNLVRYATLSGTVTGGIQELTPTDPYTDLGMPEVRLTFDGLGAVFTDLDGNFSTQAPNADPRLVTIRLDGRWVNVDRMDGPDAQIDTTAIPDVPLQVHFDDSNSHPAERDAFYHVNVAHDYIKGVDPSLAWVDYEMIARVNINQTCNAYWDGSSVNFFREGGSCANTAQIADVVYHEYGHGVTQFTYAPMAPNGAMHEGFSDYYANTLTDQPLVGLGFFGPGTWLRNSDNDRTWPAPECGGEPHCVGEVIAGALWHMRENLIASLGDHDAGVALADSLFHFARYGGNNNFEDYYWDLLVVDDDNGTLLDGTPHALEIIQAFARHNIGPGFTLDILHEPLADTEDSTASYPVVAVFASPVGLNEDSLAVYYKTSILGGGGQDWTRLAMTPTGGIREYQAEIPAQPYNTVVSYYIAGATDTLGLEATLPAGAPDEVFTFRVGVDHEPPVIAHTPLGDRSLYVWPVGVSAEVTDNLGVSEVALEYRINGVDQPVVLMTPTGEGDLYEGTFQGDVELGDVVAYRIRATDAAQDPNTAYDPPAGYHEFQIVLDVTMDGEMGAQDWTHTGVTPGYVDQWHLSSQRNHTPEGTTSWKFGDTGGGNYADLADGALLTPPVTLGTSARLTFFHWIDAEIQNASLAWDGAILELTTDGGATWELIEPEGGYPYTIIDNPASPFPGGTPCFSGSHDWQQEVFRLADYEGQTVQIRFRFGSDGAVTEEGWYVDDIVLRPDSLVASDAPTTAGTPLRTALATIRPNPFWPRTTIRLAVGEGSGKVDLAIFDVSGRRVRQLLDGRLAPGYHQVVWDGRNDAGDPVPSGMYMIRLRSRGVWESGKLMLVK